MKVYPRQLQSLRRPVLQHFEDRALDHASRCYPAHVASQAPEDLRRYLRDAIERARRYGLTTEQQVICFFDAMLLLGPAFDTNPENKWAARVLRNSTFSADYRANYLLSKACRLNNAVAMERTYG